LTDPAPEAGLVLLVAPAEVERARRKLMALAVPTSIAC
jgi:uncharacterized membrane protein